MRQYQVTYTIISVSPIYYVTFTTAVLTASFILFQGFNMTDEVKSMSLLAGFLTIFTGVYLLNFNGSDIDERPLDAALEYELASGLGSARSSPSINRVSTQTAGSPRPSRDTVASQSSASGARRRG